MLLDLAEVYFQEQDHLEWRQSEVLGMRLSRTRQVSGSKLRLHAHEDEHLHLCLHDWQLHDELFSNHV